MPQSKPAEPLPRPSEGLNAYSSSSYEIFRYSPLDLSTRSIRVIRVRPDFHDGMLVCNMVHTTTRSEYRALSYTWGNPSAPRHYVLIDEQLLEIGHNLWTFLLHARKFQPDRALWIDALSIDQRNVEEKNHQVRMMSDIYSHTEEVLVWLGARPDPHTEYAMRYMRTHKDVPRGLNATFWQGFKQINNAQYWNRVWIVQEFVQPPRGKIIQRDHCVSFKAFENTIQRLERSVYRRYLRKHLSFGRRSKDFLNTYMSTIHPLWQRRAARARASTLSPPQESWPLASGNRYCADIRDRVFGLLPLATHGAELDVDYRLNPLELLLESVWLEHDSEDDRSEILIALANILELTPESICLYSRHQTRKGQLQIVHMPHDAEETHLAAASSHRGLRDWRNTYSKYSTQWKNFAHEGLYIPRKKKLRFPNREQCPWQMLICNEDFGFKVAMQTNAAPAQPRKSWMTKQEFNRLNGWQTLAFGTYETSCTPRPVVVYYALVKGLLEVSSIRVPTYLP